MKKNLLRIVAVALTLTLSVGLLCGCGDKLAEQFVLSKNEMTLMQGDTATLLVNTTEKFEGGTYTVAWASSAPDVVGVDEAGTVTALAQGTGNVTATVTCDGKTLDLICAVTVTKNDTPLTGIGFSSNLYSIGGNQTLDLTGDVIFYPANAADKSLSWTSSSPAVATVVNGVVSPVSEGAATITASAQGGKYTAQCIVRVSAMAVEATAIALEGSRTIARGQTVTLSPIIQPANATGYSLTWTSSDPEIVTVSGGYVTGMMTGSAVITVRLSGGAGDLSSTCLVTVSDSAIDVPATAVTLSPSTLIVSEDDAGTHSFQANVTPGNYTDEVEWSVSNTELLSIDAHTGKFSVIGSLKGAKSSAVIVHCTVGAVSAQAVVMVKAPEQKLIMSESTLTLYTDGPNTSAQLVAALSGSEDLPDVTYTSSDSTVASVDKDGTVHAKKTGTCTITATCDDNHDLTATCKVTVTEPPYLVVRVGQEIALPASVPADATGWDYDTRFVTVNPTTLKVKGVRETTDEPEKIQYYSAAAPGTKVTLQVYVMPAD